MSTADRDRSFWAENAARYDGTVTRRWLLYHDRVFLPFLRGLPAADQGTRVLDVGCGTGILTLALAEAGFRVDAFDNSPDMLAIARRKAEERGVADRITFHQGDAAALPFADASFHGVTSQRMLHHLDDPRPVLNQLARVLEPGGFLYVCDETTDRTPLRRLGRRVRDRWWALRGRSRTPVLVQAPDEHAHASSVIVGTIAAGGVDVRARYVTNLPQIRKLSPRLRYGITQVVSFPWRNSTGDVVFVFGRKPG